MGLKAPPKSAKPYPSDVSDEEWSFVAPYLTLHREDSRQRDYPLRILFAVHPELLTPVQRIVHRTINTHLIQQTHVKRKDANSKPAGRVSSAPWNGVQLPYGKLRGGCLESAMSALGRNWK